MKGTKGRNALALVKAFFPKVKKVTDADEDAFFEVTQRDSDSAQVRDHGACAAAVACKRMFHLDGVIISRSRAYLVKGNRARRFELPGSTSREIVSFDRNGGFAEGKYELHRPPKTARLGGYRGPATKSDKTHSGNLTKRFRHITTGIRTVLGSEVKGVKVR